MAYLPLMAYFNLSSNGSYLMSLSKIVKLYSMLFYLILLNFITYGNTFTFALDKRTKTHLHTEVLR